MIHPENETYSTSNVPLNFTVDEPPSWIGYSLDGSDNVTVTGNTTLSGLSAGLHNLTLYAADMYGNIGASETVYFTISEPFPTLLAASVAGAAITGAAVCVYYYRKKRNHQTIKVRAKFKRREEERWITVVRRLDSARRPQALRSYPHPLER